MKKDRLKNPEWKCMILYTDMVFIYKDVMGTGEEKNRKKKGNFPEVSSDLDTSLSIYWDRSQCIRALCNITPEQIKRANWMRGWKRTDALLFSRKLPVPGSILSLSLTDDEQHDPYSFSSRVSTMAATVLHVSMSKISPRTDNLSQTRLAHPSHYTLLYRISIGFDFY